MNPSAFNEPRAWTSRQRGTMVALVLLGQCLLILVFGARKPNPVVPVTEAPSLQFARADNEFIALNDPTLFALPHANDFGAAKRMQTPAIQQPSFSWSESPRWLPLAGTNLLHSFDRFMQTNLFSTGSLDFKPDPIFSEPALPPAIQPQLHSIFSLRGNLGQRTLLNSVELGNWPAADVIAPSKVQVLVNAAGQVISSVLLPSDVGIVPSEAEFDAETHDDKADQQALKIARGVKFAPASGITVGQMIFNWHTVPMVAATTNFPPKLP